MAVDVTDETICASIEESLGRGDLLLSFERAQAAIAAGTTHPRILMLQVLALARMGATSRASQLYDRYNLGSVDSADYAALGGRLLKDRAIAADMRGCTELFAAAAARYAEVHSRFGGYFASVNAASLQYLAGDEDGARMRARALLNDPEVAAPDCYYAAATAMECHLLLGEGAQAISTLEQALAFPDASLGARASTLRQLKIFEAHGLHNDNILGQCIGRLRPPSVMTFCGYRFDCSPEQEQDICRQIDEILDRMDISIAYGALAFGADILIAEAVLRRGGELHVILPFRLDDFIAQSVTPGGKAWTARFEAAMARAASITYATEASYIGDADQFTYGSHVRMGMALLRSRHLATSAVQVAIWDGTDVAAAAGTARDVADWARFGQISHSIAPGAVKRPRSGAAPVAVPQTRDMLSIMFTDFSGFSKLAEDALPAFWSDVMGRVGKVLDGYGDAVRCRNTWGDALFAMIDTPQAAARMALEIQDALKAIDRKGMGLPADAGMRIGLHHGPVYHVHDPITGHQTYLGTEITRTARIEPVTPIGEVYATQPFAAMLALADDSGFDCQYVGRLQLAKNYAQMPMYHVSRR